MKIICLATLQLEGRIIVIVSKLICDFNHKKLITTIKSPVTDYEEDVQVTVQSY